MKTGFRTKQMLCVPVMDSGGQAIGAIQVVNSHHGRTFTDQDVDLLGAFGGYVQITILNRQQHLSGLTKIMDVDAEMIDLTFLSDKVCELAKAQRGTIFILEEDEGGTNHLYFIVDGPNGSKKEQRIPYNPKSLAGSAMIYNQVTNLILSAH